MAVEGPVFGCATACRRSGDCVAVVYGFVPCVETCPEGALTVSFEIVASDDGGEAS